MIRYILCNADNVVMGEGACVAEDLHLKAADGQYTVEIDADVEVVRGQRYINGQFLDAPPDPENVMRQLRRQRNERLIETDWTQLRDVPEATQQQWAGYRQALRDLPATSSAAQHLSDIIWPTRPGE